MRILFIGETWQGSSARSLRERLALHTGVEVAEVGSDHYVPTHQHLPMRIVNRLVRPMQVKELERAVLRSLNLVRPDVVMVYKGAAVSKNLVEQLRRPGIPVVNIFPDYSPLAYGRGLREAMGAYDLVVSTKPFHPRLWSKTYGYRNRCVCVPHGYDPQLHYWPGAPESHDTDVAVCCSWRPEYHRLMVSFADALGTDGMSVSIAGSGWAQHMADLPKHWRHAGPVFGRAYGEFLRSARIAVAPLNREVVISGVQHHGDEDTTRTYELAAAHCFFVHQRTDYVATVFDEREEVPLWTDASSLAALVRRWLPDETGRRLLASRAHARAVPAYSITERASSVLQHVATVVGDRRAPG